MYIIFNTQSQFKKNAFIAKQTYIQRYRKKSDQEFRILNSEGFNSEGFKKTPFFNKTYLGRQIKLPCNEQSYNLINNPQNFQQHNEYNKIINSFASNVFSFSPLKNIINHFRVERQDIDQYEGGLEQLEKDEQEELDKHNELFNKIKTNLTLLCKLKQGNPIRIITTIHKLNKDMNFIEKQEIIKILKKNYHEFPNELKIYSLAFGASPHAKYMQQNYLQNLLKQINFDKNFAPIILDAALKLDTRTTELIQKENIVKILMRAKNFQKLLKQKIEKEIIFDGLSSYPYLIQLLVAYVLPKPQNAFICNDLDCKKNKLTEILKHINKQPNGNYYIINNSYSHVTSIFITKLENNNILLRFWDTLKYRKERVEKVIKGVKQILKPENLTAIINNIKIQNSNGGCVFFILTLISLDQENFSETSKWLHNKYKDHNKGKIFLSKIKEIPSIKKPLYFMTESRSVLLKLNLITKKILKDFQKTSVGTIKTFKSGKINISLKVVEDPYAKEKDAKKAQNVSVWKEFKKMKNILLKKLFENKLDPITMIRTGEIFSSPKKPNIKSKRNVIIH
jgi:hypothetical protein